MNANQKLTSAISSAGVALLSILFLLFAIFGAYFASIAGELVWSILGVSILSGVVRLLFRESGMLVSAACGIWIGVSGLPVLWLIATWSR